MKKRCQTGFTLAELMTVIAILGILAALAMPLFLNAIESSRADTCKSNRRGARNLIDLAEIKSEGFIKNNLTDGIDWSTVQDKLKDIVPSPMETLCPSGGTVTLHLASEDAFSFECDIHGIEAGEDIRTDWAPGEKPATDYLPDVQAKFEQVFGLPDDKQYGSNTKYADDKMFRDTYTAYAKKQNGGELPTVDSNSILPYFPSSATYFGDTPLVWSAFRLYFDNSHHDILVLTSKHTAESSTMAPRGYLWYYNGQYYRAKTTGQKISEQYLQGGSKNKSSSLEDLISANGQWGNWEKVS